MENCFASRKASCILSTWTPQAIFECNYSQMAEKSVRVSIRSRDGGEIPTRTCKKKKKQGKTEHFFSAEISDAMCKHKLQIAL